MGNMQKGKGKTILDSEYNWDFFNERRRFFAWVTNELPPTLPFGCFMDVYIFLDRILQSRNGGIKDIESRHKMSLSEDDSTNLEIFTRELPIF